MKLKNEMIVSSNIVKLNFIEKKLVNEETGWRIKIIVKNTSVKDCDKICQVEN